ncbi:hypothetical protein [Halomarina litorea]|uniref:hypothetical protein n=1 Tax=Halomarina litorea TaxID=2961595 RepID=UPI0020C5425C|nr:hypothetical protein [Halomarina sp. BCD28]
MSDASFREVQRFRQRWLWALLAVIAVVTAVGTLGIGTLVVLGVALLIYRIRLTTEVREDGLYVQFVPFHRTPRHVPFADIEAVETERVGLLSYGGLGIRFSTGAVAYLISTGEAVRVVRSNERAVVVGTERPLDLAEALEGRR